MSNKCCVIGLGYIGLPTAAFLCQAGHSVIGVDIYPVVVSPTNLGRIHIVEPGLEDAISSAVHSCLVQVQSIPTAAVVYLIAVSTPFISNPEGLPTPNLDCVYAAAHSIAHYLCPGDLILLESMCPVGTTETIADIISILTDINLEDMHISYCPERVLLDAILSELISNDRVIGGITSQASAAAFDLYKSFCKGQLLITTSRTVELVKLSENCFRDLNIAFANELSIVSDHYGVDCAELISLANHHPRVYILSPGCGVGGHCIAVDPWFDEVIHYHLDCIALPDDPPSLAQAIIKLYRTPYSERCALSQRSRTLAESRYSRSLVVGKLHELLLSFAQGALSPYSQPCCAFITYR